MTIFHVLKYSNSTYDDFCKDPDAHEIVKIYMMHYQKLTFSEIIDEHRTDKILKQVLSKYEGLP